MGKPHRKNLGTASTMEMDGPTEAASILAVGAGDATASGAVAMEAESTKPRKVKGFAPIIVKKRGTGSKMQKKRKLRKLQKALSHQEKLVTKDAREKRTQAQKNAAKSLWDASKPDTNKFALLA